MKNLVNKMLPGHYYALPDKSNDWYYCDNVFIQNTRTLSIMNKSDVEEHERIIEVNINPDFSNAKDLDHCFSLRSGNWSISENDPSETHPICADYEYTIDGKEDKTDAHPVLFNSIEQFIAYWYNIINVKPKKYRVTECIPGTYGGEYTETVYSEVYTVKNVDEVCALAEADGFSEYSEMEEIKDKG